MRPTPAALLSGTLFGAGLAVAQMTNPAKVLGFLDVAGSWDPSLAFVMGAALVVYASAFRISQAEPGSFSFDGIDARLLVGAATFGLGWGLAGFCPGPAIASLVTGSGQVALFVAAMVAGMSIFKLVAEPRPRRSEPAAPLNAP
jgi:uncharacterized membrane protein YedE/YeeE